MEKRNYVTEYDVKEVFESLLDTNEETTTLEVKEELRDQGFWVTQKEVSTIIRENYLEWNSNTHRRFEDDHFVYFNYSIDIEIDDGGILDRPRACPSAAQDFLLNNSNVKNTFFNKSVKGKVVDITQISSDMFEVIVDKSGEEILLTVSTLDQLDDMLYTVSCDLGNEEKVYVIGGADLEKKDLTPNQARYYVWRVETEFGDHPNSENLKYFDTKIIN